MDKKVTSRGLTRLYLGVNHEDSGALRLYKRLGFESISPEPYRSAYTETNAEGDTYEVVEWLIDMVKKIT